MTDVDPSQGDPCASSKASIISNSLAGDTTESASTLCSTTTPNNIAPDPTIPSQPATGRKCSLGSPSLIRETDPMNSASSMEVSTTSSESGNGDTVMVSSTPETAPQPAPSPPAVEATTAPVPVIDPTTTSPATSPPPDSSAPMEIDAQPNPSDLPTPIISEPVPEPEPAPLPTPIPDLIVPVPAQAQAAQDNSTPMITTTACTPDESSSSASPAPTSPSTASTSVPRTSSSSPPKTTVVVPPESHNENRSSSPRSITREDTGSTTSSSGLLSSPRPRSRERSHTLIFAAAPMAIETHQIVNKDDIVIHYGLHSVQGQRAEMEDDHRCVHRGVCDSISTTRPNANSNTNNNNNGNNTNGASPPPPSAEGASTDGATSSPAEPPPEENEPEDDFTQSHPDISFFGVYDGHAGTAAAAFLRKHLHRLVLQHPKLHEDPEVALKEAVTSAEASFVQFAEEQRLDAGSTLAVVLIIGNQLVVANVGDSEVALSRGGSPVVLSTIHNMRKNTQEEDRVKEIGGRVHHKRLGHPRYNPSFFSIAVTRSIGDVFFKSTKFTEGKVSGLIAEADTQKITLQNDDRFVIIGCDGLWDVMSYQQAIDFVEDRRRKAFPVQKICEELVNEALRRGSTDNITALVITLK